MLNHAWLALLLIGCGGKGGDDCQKAFDKLKPLAKEMLGHEMSDDEAKDQLDRCHQKTKDGKHDKLVDCVLAASDEAATKACLAEKQHHEPGGRKTEAQLQLNKLGKNAKVIFVTNAEFPKGKSTTLPDGDCCKAPGGKCAVTDAWTKDPIWMALDFQLDEPGLFHYAYESADGKTFHATAVGDPACDGKTVTYSIDGTSEGGNPSIKLTEP